MRREIITLAAVAAFALVGCKGKNPEGATQRGTASRGQEAQVGESRPGAVPGNSPSPVPATQAPENAVRAPHKGKVVSTTDSAGYTYVEMEENGKRLWAAVLQSRIKKGDSIEIPDIPPMEDFHSNSLNRTFERIIFSPIVAVNGRMQTAVAQPGKASVADPHAGLKVEEGPVGVVAGQQGVMPSGSPHGGGMPSSGSPHGEMTAQGAVSGTGAVHRGKVIETMNAAGYTYIQVNENGNKLWAAVMETKVKTGDEVEFPDVPPMRNFHSSSLNRTFERIIFSPAIQVNGKPTHT